MSKEKTNKVRTHPFVDKAPVVASILMAVLGLAIAQMGPQIFKAPFSKFSVSFDWIIGLIGLAVSTTLVLLLYKWWFRPDFSGMTAGNLTEGFMLLAPILAYWGISTGYSFIFERGLLSPRMSGHIIETAFTEGVLEELCFRGILVCTLLKVWHKKDAYIKAAIVSAVIFGLIHGINIIGGANPGRTFVQVLDAGFLGLFLAAVFIRCGSVIPVMAAHSLHDIIALALPVDVSENGIITGAVTFSSYLDLILSMCLGLVAIFLLRKSKCEEIRRIWDEKWNAADRPDATMNSKSGGFH